MNKSNLLRLKQTIMDSKDYFSCKKNLNLGNVGKKVLAIKTFFVFKYKYENKLCVTKKRNIK